MGAMLSQTERATGGEHGGRTKIDGSRTEPSNTVPTLSELGITKKESARSQKVAPLVGLVGYIFPPHHTQPFNLIHHAGKELDYGSVLSL